MSPHSVSASVRGNRRRRHHQHVGVQALGRQRAALHDAEAMLLVDHHQRQRANVTDVLLHQRVRADHQMDLAALDRRQQRRGARRRDAAAQQRDAIRRVPSQSETARARWPECCSARNLGRRHERDLESRSPSRRAPRAAPRSSCRRRRRPAAAAASARASACPRRSRRAPRAGRRQLERQARRAPWRIRSSTAHDQRLRTCAFCCRRSASPVVGRRRSLRRSAAAAPVSERRSAPRSACRVAGSAAPQRVAAPRPALARENVGRHRIEHLAGSCRAPATRSGAAYCRRHAARALVDRDDAAGVNDTSVGAVGVARVREMMI